MRLTGDSSVAERGSSTAIDVLGAGLLGGNRSGVDASNTSLLSAPSASGHSRLDDGASVDTSQLVVADETFTSTASVPARDSDQKEQSFNGIMKRPTSPSHPNHTDSHPKYVIEILNNIRTSRERDSLEALVRQARESTPRHSLSAYETAVIDLADRVVRLRRVLSAALNAKKGPVWAEVPVAIKAVKSATVASEDTRRRPNIKDDVLTMPAAHEIPEVVLAEQALVRRAKLEEWEQKVQVAVDTADTVSLRCLMQEFKASLEDDTHTSLSSLYFPTFNVGKRRLSSAFAALEQLSRAVEVRDASGVRRALKRCQMAGVTAATHPPAATAAKLLAKMSACREALRASLEVCLDDTDMDRIHRLEIAAKAAGDMRYEHAPEMAKVNHTLTHLRLVSNLRRAIREATPDASADDLRTALIRYKDGLSGHHGQGQIPPEGARVVDQAEFLIKLHAALRRDDTGGDDDTKVLLNNVPTEIWSHAICSAARQAARRTEQRQGQVSSPRSPSSILKRSQSPRDDDTQSRLRSSAEKKVRFVSSVLETEEGKETAMRLSLSMRKAARAEHPRARSHRRPPAVSGFKKTTKAEAMSRLAFFKSGIPIQPGESLFNDNDGDEYIDGNANQDMPAPSTEGSAPGASPTGERSALRKGLAVTSRHSQAKQARSKSQTKSAQALEIIELRRETKFLRVRLNAMERERESRNAVAKPPMEEDRMGSKVSLWDRIGIQNVGIGSVLRAASLFASGATHSQRIMALTAARQCEAVPDTEVGFARAIASRLSTTDKVGLASLAAFTVSAAVIASICT